MDADGNDGNSGRTLVIEVRSPATDAAAYAAYRGRCRRNPEPHKAWATTVLAQYGARCDVALRALAQEIGLSPSWRWHGAPPMDHDSRYASVAWGGMIEIGWRENAGAHEVAILPAGAWRTFLAEPGEPATELVATGRSPSAFVEAYEALVASLGRLAASCLGDHGIDVVRREPALTDEALAEEKFRTRKLMGILESPPDHNLGLIEGEERIEVARNIEEMIVNGDEPPFRMLVAVYDSENRRLVTFVPGEDGNPVGDHDVPEAAEDDLEELEPTEGVAAPGTSPEMIAWARSVSGGRGRDFVVLPDEYARAAEGPFVVAWDRDGARIEVEFPHPEGIDRYGPRS